MHGFPKPIHRGYGHFDDPVDRRTRAKILVALVTLVPSGTKIAGDGTVIFICHSDLKRYWLIPLKNGDFP